MVSSIECLFELFPAKSMEALCLSITKADGNWLRIGPDRYNSEAHDFESPWPFGPESGAQ
jgi:hypothetical protein